MITNKKFAKYPIALAAMVAVAATNSTVLARPVLRSATVCKPAAKLQIVAWHDATSALNKKKLDQYGALGYRTLSLSVYGDRDDPRWAVVLVKRPVVVAEYLATSSGIDGFQKTFDDYAKKGWGPVLVSATGPAKNPLIAATFQPMSSIPLTRTSLSESEFRALNIQQRKNGGILRSFDAFGTAKNTRYIAVWNTNTTGEKWNCYAIDEDSATLQTHFDKMTSLGMRPAYTAITPSQNFTQMFTNASIGTWTARADLTSEAYQAQFDEQMAKGLVPIQVAAEGTGDATRFAAIFARRENS